MTRSLSLIHPPQVISFDASTILSKIYKAKPRKERKRIYKLASLLFQKVDSSDAKWWWWSFFLGGGGEWQDPLECIQHDDLTMLDDVWSI